MDFLSLFDDRTLFYSKSCYKSQAGGPSTRCSFIFFIDSMKHIYCSLTMSRSCLCRHSVDLFMSSRVGVGVLPKITMYILQHCVVLLDTRPRRD